MRKRHLKIRGLMLATVVSAAIAAPMVPAAAQAEPGGPDGANWQAHFYDCTGPAGTPSSFDAESQHLGAAWHLTDSRQIFVGLIGFDETTDTLAILTPGFLRNAVEAVTCRSVRASNQHVYLVTGVLTPATSG